MDLHDAQLNTQCLVAWQLWNHRPCWAHYATPLYIYGIHGRSCSMSFIPSHIMLENNIIHSSVLCCMLLQGRCPVPCLGNPHFHCLIMHSIHPYCKKVLQT